MNMLKLKKVVLNNEKWSRYAQGKRQDWNKQGSIFYEFYHYQRLFKKIFDINLVLYTQYNKTYNSKCYICKIEKSEQLYSGMVLKHTLASVAETNLYKLVTSIANKFELLYNIKFLGIDL